MEANLRPVVVLDAPTNLGLKPPAGSHEPGTRYAPQALREAGILDALGAIDGGVVAPPPYDFDPPGHNGIRNVRGIRDYSRSLANRVGEILDTGQFPIVLGGDCSILLGTTLALRQRGRFGLAYLDGHSDLLTAETTQTGGAAGMDLALVTGHGPAALTNFDGLVPLVHEQDIIAIGIRDGSDASPGGSQTFAAAGGTFSNLEETRRLGIEQTVTRTRGKFAHDGTDGFWIHVDVDVLDSGIMPAVDSPQPDGLSSSELIGLLRGLLKSDRVVGLQVTIFDPELDPSGTCASLLVELLGESVRNVKTA